MPILVDKGRCCGCGACANKCSKSAIAMTANEEGFLHPVVNNSLCVECGMCEEVCPGLNPAVGSKEEPKAFVVQHKNDAIRKQSTSGGAFTAIAEEIIRRGGVVYGAAMTSDLKVCHEKISKIEDLYRFRNSKYVQSEIGECYKEAKKMLATGQYVCFSGTPCQINGLYKYLGNDFENLIAIDVVCKSVPSPLVFQKYVEFKKSKKDKISDIVFRDKKRGFLYCTMAHYATHEDRAKFVSQYRRGSESDEWLRLFLSGKISRRSCTCCQYQSLDRVGDITLGDIWETNRASMDDNKGTTLVHVWTKKGLNLMVSIKNNVRCEEYPELYRSINRENTISIQANREQLFEDANHLTNEQFFTKYAPYNAKVRILNNARLLLYRLNLQTFIRHLKHLIIHRK